ncbi:putative dimethylaniline monooxygenase [Teratosphaeria nubilosa]|uniref:Putative dimethylaniline monooxygenase n=1 Tax=Teratosphaeria nubilosa TaxID=161662 RepID=A0A6G1LF69_9PEZI|nr:putative dimethylaniline monooxygenase [Teratosphaeria nubilosa]
MAPGINLSEDVGQHVLEVVQSYAKNIPQSDETGYIIPDTLLGQKRRVRILVIGFGAAAINLVHIFGKDPSNHIEIQCYEKNPEVGGTWYENRYPGCACDIPSVNYQFSWHPKPDWSSYYATAPEILGYFMDVCQKHDLYQFAKMSHTVSGAWWNEEAGKWKIEVQPNGDPAAAFYDEGEILVNATGVLNNWKWPAVPGIEKFKSKLHSAAWDDTVELQDKSIGLIGNGSSAVQILPAIFPKVKHVVSFMRSSTWITAGFAQKYAGPNGANFEYSEEQKKRFAEHPEEYLEYRKMVEGELNQRFKFIINGSEEQKEALDFSRKEMSRKLNGRQELIEKLVPTDYAVGCRRPTPGNGYLECLTNEEKCQVSFSPIQEITENAVCTQDGRVHEFDVLICGTGFDVSFKPRFPIVGKNDRDLAAAWAKTPETYLSATAPGFPNYFMINGPFGPYGHGSILPVIEIITRYIEKFIVKMQTQNIMAFEPKQEAVDDFKRHRELFLLRTAWSSPCRSWFKGGTVDGPIMMWPGSRLHFFEALKDPRFEDYNWTYQANNRFSFWGNGFSQREFEDDNAWYIAGV